METTENTSEKISLTAFQTSLKSLYPRYTANTVVNVEPKPIISPNTAAAITANTPKLMMIPKLREFFCFAVFLLLSIINDIFFTSASSVASVVLCFECYIGVGLRTVKVFSKNTTRREMSFKKKI